MYWVSYYLQKGYKLDYLLNLNHNEQLFFKKSMEAEIKQKVLYDKEKFKALIEILSKMFGGA